MKIRVALIYPNSWEVGIANLGFNRVYGIINSTEGFICERWFYNGKLEGIDSKRDIREYHIIAFSISSFNDYLKLPEIIKQAGIEPISGERKELFPFVIGGGNALSINPEPVAEIFDVIIIGDAEGIIENSLQIIKNGKKRDEILERMNELPSIYVPLLNTPEKRKPVLKNTWEPDRTPSFSSHGGKVFKDAGLVEIGRGCRWKCKFCPIGFFHVPPRFYEIEKILEACRRTGKKRIGLIAPVVPDHPQIEDLLKEMRKEGFTITTSSWRADLYNPEIFELLKNGQKSITVAPEAGSERLRRFIGKELPDEVITNFVREASRYFQNIRFYFIVGLPGEKDDDIKAIIDMIKRCSSIYKRGRITLRINPFVPMPHTPFENERMLEKDEIMERMDYIKKHLQKYVVFKSKNIRDVLMEGVIAQGGREILKNMMDGSIYRVKTEKDKGEPPYRFIIFPFNTPVVSKEGVPPCPSGCKLCIKGKCKRWDTADIQ